MYLVNFQPKRFGLSAFFMTDNLKGIYSDTSCTSIAVNFIVRAIYMTG